GPLPVRQPVIADSRVVTCTYAGEHASSPRNSPSCHWRLRNHTASRTGAARGLSSETLRGRGSSRFQVVIEAMLRVPPDESAEPVRRQRRYTWTRWYLPLR